MNQQERLNYLVERFTEDSGEYKNLQVGDSEEEKRTVLRSLMNIRMPGSISPEDSERISDRRCKRERNRFP